MNRHLLSRIEQAAALFVSVSILMGCAPTVLPVEPTVSPIQPTLTALVLPVQVSRPNASGTKLKLDETVVVGIDDRIDVPESGRARVRIANRLTVDVLRDSNFTLSEVRQEPGDALFIRARQTKGHSSVALDQNANVRLLLETDFATIRTLEPGTKFIVCHDPSLLTCTVAESGAIEVAGQGKVVRVKAGEGTFIPKDGPPSPAICADLTEVDFWLNEKLGSGKVGALGELVDSWKKQPCSAATARPTTTETSTAQPEPPALPASDGMVKIEAGTYTVGSKINNQYHVPPMEKELPGFWIDAHEVTNAQYAAFVGQTNYQQLSSGPGRENHPVAGVTWDDADAYCTWAYKRLPTETEWEVAARGPGPEPPLYPWSNDPGAEGRINSIPRTATYEVGSIPFNVSTFGVYDMAGNVWEWVDEPYDPVSEGMKLLRGGRYGFIVDMAYRQEAERNSQRFVPYAGFRCAADRVQGE